MIAPGASIHQSTSDPGVWRIRIGGHVRTVVIAPERGRINPWAAEKAVEKVADDFRDELLWKGLI